MMKITARNPKPRRNIGIWLLLSLLIILIGGCGSGRQADDAIGPKIALNRTGSEYERISVGDETAAADIEALIAPYRTEMMAKMGEQLAICPVEMRTGRPEGIMGNFVADIVLHRARTDAPVGVSVDAGLVNNGGLRVSWSKGEISLGLVYELMPFDNEIYLLRFSGEQMSQLADDIAARGGEPVAGLHFAIRDTVAENLTVSGAPVAADRDYWVATSDYLANGGGGMQTLWESREVVKTGVLIRDAIADWLREFCASGDGALGEIPRPTMNRITEAGEGGRRNDY
jgi:2',3'-cyclic-nucleotide 2'-phosphodiesterase (5'-nucleotidase family)